MWGLRPTQLYAFLPPHPLMRLPCRRTHRAPHLPPVAVRSGEPVHSLNRSPARTVAIGKVSRVARRLMTATEEALAAVKAMLHRGFILLPEGEHGNVISFTPPLTITEAQLARTVKTLAEVLECGDLSPLSSVATRRQPRWDKSPLAKAPTSRRTPKTP